MADWIALIAASRYFSLLIIAVFMSLYNWALKVDPRRPLESWEALGVDARIDWLLGFEKTFLRKDTSKLNAHTTNVATMSKVLIISAGFTASMAGIEENSVVINGTKRLIQNDGSTNPYICFVWYFANISAEYTSRTCAKFHAVQCPGPAMPRHASSSSCRLGSSHQQFHFWLCAIRTSIDRSIDRKFNCCW